ncbi:MAG: aldo/keto reductase [Gammaproteobacteria bacterium]|nr:aldo/keto reductase [Gammaproteobacteria bacterium]
MTRAEFIRILTAVLLSASASASRAQTGDKRRMQTRPIPSSGERLPVIGCGTWLSFDVPTGQRRQLTEVLEALFEAGGSVIDSSPEYGAAEAVVGELLSTMNAQDRAFLATKVWSRGREPGIRQMNRSFELLQDDVIDLMQVHNLIDWRTHLETMQAWKREGRIRYLGITHYTERAHDDIEAIMRSESLDFIQLNYAANDRGAAQRLLPLAEERGIAIIVNRPFGGGGLLRRLSRRTLPAWATELGCTSWAQILLKFVLAQPAVTCVIPGTGNPAHMRDNVAAGVEPFPNASLQRRIITEISA